MPLKECTGCHRTLPMDAFGPHRGVAHARGTCRRCNAGASKRWREKNLERSRAATREYMREMRQDPDRVDALRARERASYARNNATAKARYHRLKETDFFKWKARKTQTWLTADQLRELWERQGGRCALSGRPLDKTSELDHKIPRSRGGADTFENTQWLCREANQAKRNLLDGEFIALCREIVARADALNHLQHREAA